MINYYNILRINPTASEDEIKRSFRKLAKLYHPDINKGSEERFKQILEAYEVLSDPKKRFSHDRKLEEYALSNYNLASNHSNSQYKYTKSEKIIDASILRSPITRYFIGFSLFFLLAVLIDYLSSDSEYQQTTKFNRPETGSNLESYDSLQYDFSRKSSLEITTVGKHDFIVRLLEIDSNNHIINCNRAVYIRSSDTFRIKNIPEGRYHLMYAYGEDLKKEYKNNKNILIFNRYALYQYDTATLDFRNEVLPSDTIDGYIYTNWVEPSFSIELRVDHSTRVPRSGLQNISEDNFNL